MLGLTPDDRGLWLLSSRGRDRLSLVRVDVASGSESLVYDDPELDLEWVGMSERTREPLAVVTYPGRQAIRFFDAALEADLAVFRRHSPTRSEERRVGEECRSRWSPYHLKKKKNR